MKKISNSRLRLYGISRAELAAALYVSPRTLASRMANTDTLTLGELRIIARKLHCSIADLGGGGHMRMTKLTRNRI